jgi:hypothetical protein
MTVWGASAAEDAAKKRICHHTCARRIGGPQGPKSFVQWRKKPLRIIPGHRRSRYLRTIVRLLTCQF